MSDQNIIQFKAENQRLDFTIEDDDGNTLDLTAPNIQNVYLDISTFTFQYGETKLEKTGTNLSSDGTVDFELVSSDTNDFTVGNYLYEVWVEYSGSENYVAEVGKFFVKPRVDR